MKINLAHTPEYMKALWPVIEKGNCVTGETEAEFVENVRRQAREVNKHFVEGNSASYGLGWRLYEVWIGLQESDATCSKAEAYERLAAWIVGLGLDPETAFVPNAAQLRYIIDHIHENENCDLGMLF